MNISSLKPYVASLLLTCASETQSQLANIIMRDPIQEYTTLLEDVSGPYQLKRDDETKSGNITYKGYLITFSHDGIVSYDGVRYQLESNNVFGIDLSLIDISWQSSEEKFIFTVQLPLGKMKTTEMSVQYIDAMCEGIINEKKVIIL